MMYDGYYSPLCIDSTCDNDGLVSDPNSLNYNVDDWA